MGLLTLRQVMRRYRVSQHTVYRAVAEGRLDRFQPKGRILYSAEQVARVFARNIFSTTKHVSLNPVFETAAGRAA